MFVFKNFSLVATFELQEILYFIQGNPCNKKYVLARKYWNLKLSWWNGVFFEEHIQFERIGVRDWRKSMIPSKSA